MDHMHDKPTGLQSTSGKLQRVRLIISQLRHRSWIGSRGIRKPIIGPSGKLQLDQSNSVSKRAGYPTSEDVRTLLHVRGRVSLRRRLQGAP